MRKLSWACPCGAQGQVFFSGLDTIKSLAQALAQARQAGGCCLGPARIERGNFIARGGWPWDRPGRAGFAVTRIFGEQRNI